MTQKIGSGVITPLLTPIGQDESVNYAQLGHLLDYVIAGGVNAVFVMGSSGEFARFDTSTRAKIISESVKKVSGRVPVYAGVSDAGLLLVQRNIELAQKGGADAVVITLPYYFPVYNDDEAYSFFKSAATCTDLPVILYEIPKTCGASISLEVIDKLFDIKNFVGVKDSSGDINRLKELISRFKGRGKEFAVTVGDERLCYEGFMAGADGIVPSLSNPFPKLLADVYSAACAKDEKRLKELCAVVDQMNQLNTYNNSWMWLNVWRKKALFHLGVCDEYCTKPYNSVDSGGDLKVMENIKLYRKMYGGDAL